MHSETQRAAGRGWKVTLAVFGISALVFGAALWLDTSAPGTSVVQKKSTTTVMKTGSNQTTTVESTDQTSPGTASLRSDVVVAAALGIGAVLLLCAAFFGRISSVTLPGGATLELLPVETQAEMVRDTVAGGSVRGITDDPDQLAAVYADAVRTYLARAEQASPGHPTAMSARASTDARTTLAKQAVEEALERAAGADPRRR